MTYVRSDVAGMLAMAAQNPRPTLRELGATATRETMRQLGKLVDLPVGELAKICDFSVESRDGSAIAVRLFDAKSERADGPVMLYMHGGGFVFGDLDTHAPVCAEIARRLDVPVLAVDYRLAPEYPWPAAQNDCVDVARWLTNGGHELGFAPDGLVLCGDSAGSWLSVVVALELLDQNQLLPLRAMGLIYPLVDLECGRYASFEECASGYTLTADGMDWFIECFQPDADDRFHNLVSLVRSDLPPTVTISAGLDPLRDQGRAFAAALSSVGGTSFYIEARGQVHGFVGSRAGLPSARDDLDDFLSLMSAALTLVRDKIDRAA